MSWGAELEEPCHRGQRCLSTLLGCSGSLGRVPRSWVMGSSALPALSGLWLPCLLASAALDGGFHDSWVLRF